MNTVKQNYRLKAIRVIILISVCLFLLGSAAPTNAAPPFQPLQDPFVYTVSFDDTNHESDWFDWVYYVPDESQFAFTWDTSLDHKMAPEITDAGNPISGYGAHVPYYATAVARISFNQDVTVTAASYDSDYYLSWWYGRAIQLTDDAGTVIYSADTWTGGDDQSISGSWANVRYVYIIVGGSGQEAQAWIDNISVSVTAASDPVTDITGKPDAGIPGSNYRATTTFESIPGWMSFDSVWPTNCGDDWQLLNDNRKTPTITASSGNPAPALFANGTYGTNFSFVASIILPEEVDLYLLSMDVTGINWVRPSICVTDASGTITAYKNAHNYAGSGTYTTEDLSIGHARAKTIYFGVDDATATSLYIDNVSIGMASASGWVLANFSNGLLQPVKSSDLVTHTEFTDGSGNFTSPSIISTLPDAPLYAIATGTVTGVTDNGATNGVVLEVIYGSLTVRYNNLSTAFVRAGDEVDPGCILGIAGPKYTDIADPPAVGYSQFSFSVTDETGFLDWTAWGDPSSSSMCGSTYRTENCITNNPNLKGGAKGWVPSKPPKGGTGVAELEDGSVILRAGSYIYQDLILTGGPYYVTVIAGTMEGLPRDVLTVTLGDITQDLDIISSGYNSLDVYTSNSVSLSGPLSGDIYRLKISNENLNSPGINLDHVCLHDGSASYGSARCYFNEDGIWKENSPTVEGWALTGSVTQQEVNGLLHFWQLNFHAINDSVTNAVVLPGYDDQAKDYFLWVNGQLGGAGIHHAPTDVFNFDVRIDDEYSATLVDIGDLDMTNYWFNKEYVFKFSVPAATTYDGDFILEVADLTADTSYIAATVKSICISPTNGQWIGDESKDDEGEAQSSKTCLAFPDTPAFSITEIGDWIAYLGSVIVWLFSCTLIPFIRNIYNSIIQAVGGIGALGKFIGALYKYNGKWAIGWVKAGFGLLNNLLMFALSTLLGWLMILIGPDWLAALLDFWGYFQLGRELVWDVIQAVLNLLNTLIKGMIGLLKVAYRIYSVSKAAYNVTDVQDLSYPVCPGIDDMAPLAPLCWGVDAVNEIVNNTPPILAAGAIVAAVMSWFTINWTIRQLNSAAGDM